jgi:hypothetical protein
MKKYINTYNNIYYISLSHCHIVAERETLHARPSYLLYFSLFIYPSLLISLPLYKTLSEKYCDNVTMSQKIKLHIALRHVKVCDNGVTMVGQCDNGR